jgi:hypothetical protein
LAEALQLRFEFPEGFLKIQGKLGLGYGSQAATLPRPPAESQCAGVDKCRKS